jgi:hypothetical protein
MKGKASNTPVTAQFSHHKLVPTYIVIGPMHSVEEINRIESTKESTEEIFMYHKSMLNTLLLHVRQAAATCKA